MQNDKNLPDVSTMDERPEEVTVYEGTEDITVHDGIEDGAADKAAEDGTVYDDIEAAAAEETTEDIFMYDSTENADSEDGGVEMSGSVSPRVYAGFFVRMTAYLLDKIIVGVPLIIVRIILWLIRDIGSADFLLRRVFFSFTVTDVILYLISIGYFVLMTYYTGRTFGKKIMKIKVVSAEDRKPTFFEIAFREIIGRYLSAFILGIGYLMIGAGSQKEALHDYLADTRVVYAIE